MKSILIVSIILVLSIPAAFIIHRDKLQTVQYMFNSNKNKGRAPVDADIAGFLAPYQDKLQSSKKAALQITLETLPKDDVYVSKVGGMAYWPEGEEYPKGSDGNPLYLLAQLRFEEMPELPGYPKTGMLQFFIADTDYYGANFDGDFSPEQLQDQKDFRVRYWPQLESTHQAITLGESEMLPHDPKRPRRMKFNLKEELLSGSDFRFDQMFGGDQYAAIEKYAALHKLDSDGLADAIWERFDGSGHKIGGYPFFTQQDPRSRPGMELLFQLDSDDDMMWGDSGVGGFFISPDDLQKRDFSRVVYNWDCH